MKLTEEEFIEWLVNPERSDEPETMPGPPDSFYKKFSEELNAEKIMFVVLRARSLRKNKLKAVVTSGTDNSKN